MINGLLERYMNKTNSSDIEAKIMEDWMKRWQPFIPAHYLITNNSILSISFNVADEIKTICWGSVARPVSHHLRQKNSTRALIQFCLDYLSFCTIFWNLSPSYRFCLSVVRHLPRFFIFYLGFLNLLAFQWEVAFTFILVHSRCLNVQCSRFLLPSTEMQCQVGGWTQY